MTANIWGRLVRELRQEAGPTLNKFGSLCGIPWRTVQDFERGRHTPSIDRAEQMFAALDHDLEVIPRTCGIDEGEK